MSIFNVSDSGVLWSIKTIGNLLGKWAPLLASAGGIMTIVLGFVNNVLVGSLTYIIESLDRIDVSGFTHPTLAGLDMLSTLNCLFPISEFVTFLTAYWVAWGIIVCIRWVKSFVPTVAN